MGEQVGSLYAEGQEAALYSECFSETYYMPKIADAMVARTTALLFVLPQGVMEDCFRSPFTCDCVAPLQKVDVYL